MLMCFTTCQISLFCGSIILNTVLFSLLVLEILIYISSNIDYKKNTGETPGDQLKKHHKLKMMLLD